MKKSKVLLFIILILVVIGVGVSFGFLLVGTNITGEGSVNTGKIGKFLKVTYDAGNAKFEANNLYPGKSASKNFTIKVEPGSKQNSVIYSIYFNITHNGFVKCNESNYDNVTNKCEKNAEELVYSLSEDGEEIVSGDLTGQVGKIRLANITKENLTEAKTYNYTLTITFKDTGKDQNHNGKDTTTLEGNIDVEYDEKVFTSKDMLAKLKIDSNYIKGTISQITGPACASGTNSKTHDSGDCTITGENGIYEATTSEGTTYYYRGTVNNNWVKFGNYWWRIIRINENGTVRMIYSGTNNTGTQPDKNDGRWVPLDYFQYKSNQYNMIVEDDNVGVGFKYGDANPSGNNDIDKYNNTHKNENDSAILEALKTWYNDDSSMDKSLIDGETGFCNDREIAATNHGNDSYNNLGYAKNATYYAAYDRAHEPNSESNASEQKPTFECKNKTRDLFTTRDSSNGNGALDIPVGLITMDEVIYAGGFGGSDNYGYWLYTGQYYWTMTPSDFDIYSLSNVFDVNQTGSLAINAVSDPYTVRPVINLKATTNFSGSGTVDDPYIPS